MKGKRREKHPLHALDDVVALFCYCVLARLTLAVTPTTFGIDYVVAE